MSNKSTLIALQLTLALAGPVHALANGQTKASLSGTITLENTGQPVHGVTVTILQLKRSIETDTQGRYQFPDIQPGAYDVSAHLDRVPDVVKRVEIAPGTAASADFQLRLRVVREQITVTASGEEETSFNSIQSVVSLSSVELAERNSQSLGEALDHQLGVSKRSLGPGASRPIVRGFDGDRVLILQDGNRIGSLGYQSGDHAEPVDVLTLDRVEIVKGPATLLYGSNAIGGVVNTITGHDSAHPGVRGYVTGIASTNNDQAGGGGGIEAGTKNWLFWAGGGGQRAGDYEAPAGRITNSYTRNGSGAGGLGYYTGKGHVGFDYAFDDRRYGIPVNVTEEDPEVVYLNPRRHSFRLHGGFHDLERFLSGAQFTVQYNDYRHQEVEAPTGEIGTDFRNKTVNYRGLFEQKQVGKWNGSFGFWGLHRDYKSTGEEALAPPAIQNAFALFGLQKIDFERVSIQFGGRFEHNGYDPSTVLERPTPKRSFNGFSGAIGIRVPTWEGGAFVAHYSHSYRAPDFEELYNLGPHHGNSTFEIGDPDLESERNNGIDLSVRHSTPRLRAELNYFYYHIRNFIFLAPTEETDEESGLAIADYAQGASRYTGVEARLDVAVHPRLWLLSQLDYVNAELADTATPLPRIPPLRSRIGLEATYRGFRFHPEVVMARDQDRTFPIETRTAGYAVFNVAASYTIASQHVAQIISLDGFNLGDRLYRNHLSFIKEFSPEIGRGVRLTYTLRFF